MASKKGHVTIRGRFDPGSTVNLHRRTGDTPFGPSIGSRKPEQTAKFTKDGASFTGLEEGERYWVSQEVDGEWRHAAVTAKGKPAPKPKSAGALEPGYVNQGLGKRRRVIEGARSTVDVKATREQTTLPKLHEKQDQPEMAPRIAQADVSKNTPQRSATPIGEAHPVEPGEPQPRPAQDQVEKGSVQRSDTELGEATVKAKDEQSPSRRQEDVGKGVKQRSATPGGEAEPIPEPNKPAKQAERRSSSAAKGRGETPAKPQEKTNARKKSKGAKRSAKTRKSK